MHGLGQNVIRIALQVLSHTVGRLTKPRRFPPCSG
jgi:hypothetical protein